MRRYTGLALGFVMAGALVTAAAAPAAHTPAIARSIQPLTDPEPSPWHLTAALTDPEPSPWRPAAVLNGPGQPSPWRAAAILDSPGQPSPWRTAAAL